MILSYSLVYIYANEFLYYVHRIRRFYVAFFIFAHAQKYLSRRRLGKIIILCVTPSIEFIFI